MFSGGGGEKQAPVLTLEEDEEQVFLSPMSHLTVGAGLALSLGKGAIPQLRWVTLFSCYTAEHLYTHPSNIILKWQVWHSTWTWRCNNSGMKPGNATWQNSLHPSQHFFLTACTKMKNQQTELTPADASSWKIHKYIRCLILFCFPRLGIFCVCVGEKKNFNWERARFLSSKMSKVDLYALFLWLNDWCFLRELMWAWNKQDFCLYVWSSGIRHTDLASC